MKDEKHSGFKTQRNMRKSATAAPTDIITPAHVLTPGTYEKLQKSQIVTEKNATTPR